MFSLSPPQATVHKGSVNFVAISGDDALIASGGDDATVVILDAVSESSRCRLRGHTGPITAVLWIERAGAAATLISASKDALIKIWDVATQHCMHTIVGHRAEVWAIATDRLQRRLVTGSNDGLLRVWDIELLWNPQATRRVAVDSGTDLQQQDEHANAETAVATVQIVDPIDAAAAWTDAAVRVDQQSPAQYMGAVQRRNARGRVGQLMFAPDDDSLLICVPAGAHFIEFFICRDSKGVKQHRRRRKARERARRDDSAAGAEPADVDGDGDGDGDEGGGGGGDDDTVAADEFAPLCQMEAPHRVRSVDVCGRIDRGEPLARSKRLQLLVSMRNNAVATFVSGASSDDEPTVDKDDNGDSVLQLRAQSTIEHAGHRSDLRHVALSADGALLLTGARDGAKVWSVERGAVLRTLDGVSVLAGCFVPGANHVLLGTKAGELLVYELSSQRCTQVLSNAHDGSIWSVQFLPGSPDCFATAGGDKKVHMWQLELVQTEADAPLQLNARVTRTLELPDDALSLRFTADGKLLAVALLDHTIKVHFVDSFKFFVALYGHRLPVMAIDTSSDNALLVSGSSDKNVKIWGLDFGDCHRSMFAHEDAVMAVAFQPNTHYFFSAGKDGAVKYWDADIGELVMVLSGHHGPVWSLAIGEQAGEPFVVSAGADRTWRVWERTDSLVFAEEERELRVEARLEAVDLDRAEHGAGIIDERETTAATRDTADTLKAAERLGEALRLADGELSARAAAHAAKRARATATVVDATDARVEDIELVALYDDATDVLPNQLLLGLKPSRYVLRQVREIRRTELDAALLALPLDHCASLLRYVLRWLECGIAVELSTRIATFVVRAHAGVLCRSTLYAPLLDKLARTASLRLREYRDEIGFNEAALSFLQRELEAKNVRVFTNTNQAVRDMRAAARKRTASTTL
jgi:U3 small nucleolar RNA-associated protein 12